MYGIGLTKFVEIRNSLGLQHTRQQAHTPESIHPAMMVLQKMYPDAGMRDMISLIFHEHNMSVSRSVMQKYFITYEPQLVRQHKANHLQCHCFWAAGVNDIWAVDQHDKWLHFGLALHMGIEPFSGHILWMKVWHSNRNLQLILSYYMEIVEKFGFIPMVTQSDPGTENFGTANTQTMLRQVKDPSLQGFNIMPEIAWSQLRHRFAPGFEGLLNEGLMVFRWLFIPWLQQELDNYQSHINNTRKCHDKKKVLLHGIPKLIHTCATDYRALDFKAMVNQGAIDHIHQLYMNPNHAVFELVSPPLSAFLELCYNELGRPPVERETIWMIYRSTLELIRQCEEMPVILMAIDANDTVENGEMALLEGLRNLPEMDYYMGGVSNGMGLSDEPHVDGNYNEIDAEPLLFAEFSDTEDDEHDKHGIDNRL
ncbi:hypothetical protein BDN67DRAFT_992298 [Paxillus ammoniavirescens]|nr:hypothetical protein BDN67DRAFT_992298 [Paxillus ammoniavirescens]